MKRLIRCVSLLLVMSMLMTVPAFAAEAPKASYYFGRLSTYLEKTSGTSFEVWFDVTATGTMEELGVSTIKVQRSSDRSSWTTVKTFSKADYSQMTDDNTVSHADCVTYTGTAGYYYRAKVTFYAENNSGSSEYVMYTDTISVP